MFITKYYYLAVILGAIALSGCQSSVPRPAGPPPAAGKVVQQARAQLGTPYRYGGESPNSGFDCSGLVYYSHRKLGYQVPRTTGEQYRHSHPISRHQLRPGDLVFFRFRRSRRVSHVGIYLGANRFVHAPAKNKRVSIARLDTPFWSRHFVRGGRFRL